VPERLARALPGLHRFTVDKFRVDEAYDLLVVRPFAWFSMVCWKVIDVGIIDGLVNGVARVAAWIASIVRLFQNGDLQRYAAIMVVAAAILLGLALGAGGHP
jgi:NADH-quinone oxidoreductase subunit L